MNAFLGTTVRRLLIASLLLIALVPIYLLVKFRSDRAVSASDPDLQTSEQDQIDAYIEDRMRTANIPGLALGVVRSGEVIFLKGYGVAGADGRAVTPQTPFIIGSLSKSLTALAVMQLVEAGQIDLDAPVTRYLPWFRTADPAASAQITVRHLLHQDSGLPVYAGRRGMADVDQADTALENGVRELATIGLSRPAGQGFEYANENYTTLGLIVQAVSGEPYEEFIRTQIFAPLQMRHSAATLSDPAAQDLATGYRYWLRWPIAFEAPYPRRQTPAGFLMSSAEDMSHYVLAYLNGGAYAGQQVLSPAGMATLLAPGARMGATSAYAMGWVVRDQGGSIKIEHSGDVSNFHANMLLLPDRKLGIVILTNVGGFNNAAALNLPIEGVAAILQGRGVPPALDPPTDWLTPVQLLLPLLIAVVWLAGSFVPLWRWQRRGAVPVRGWPILWRYGLPLAVDLGLAGTAWIVLPARFQTPMTTIGLFATDVFVILGSLTVLGLAGALGRSMFVFRPSRRIKAAGRRTGATRVSTQAP